MAKAKLTPERQERIVNSILAGNYLSVAAAVGGISESTLYRWLERGEQSNSGIYKEFWEAVKRAEAEAEAIAVAHVKAAMPDDWRAAMTYLERRHPDRWGRRAVDVNHSGDATIAVTIDR